MSTFIVFCFAYDFYAVVFENGSRVEQSTKVFSTIQAMANAYSVWAAGYLKPHITAKATALDIAHVVILFCPLRQPIEKDNAVCLPGCPQRVGAGQARISHEELFILWGK